MYGVKFKNHLKGNIKITDIRPELIEIIKGLITVAKDIEKDIVITSINDHKHRVESRHYYNLAIDIRIWGLKRNERNKILEKFNTHNFKAGIHNKNHIHIEWRL